MTVGKNPHRPEGKANTDNEHMQAVWMNEGPAHDASRNDKAIGDRNRRLMGDSPGREDQEEPQVGGSRPGVPSLVKDAIARREAREGEDDGEAA